MKLIRKLICKIFGHKFGFGWETSTILPEMRLYGLCLRCGKKGLLIGKIKTSGATAGLWKGSQK